MRNLNRITLIGYVGHEPQWAETEGGAAELRLQIAVNERLQRGVRTVEHTEWFRVSIFGKGAIDTARFVRKGSAVLVEGEGRHIKRTARDGIERTSFEVHADSILQFTKATDARGAGSA
jgi:single-strand DNA-binding protein